MQKHHMTKNYYSVKLLIHLSFVAIFNHEKNHETFKNTRKPQNFKG